MGKSKMKARTQGRGSGTRRPRATTRRWLVVSILVFAGLATAGVLLATGRDPDGRVVEQFTHIHGLAVPAWAGGDVFVSTHFGLIKIGGDGVWREVGSVKHDFMGFTAHPTDADVLYSSGHPAAGSGLPNPIGFMVSRDGGLSWRTVALAGRADFHVLTVQPTDGDVLYGFNVAVEPGLYRSVDAGESWERIDSEPLMQLGGPLALAVHPDDRDVLLAGTRAGLLVSRDGGASWRPHALDGVPVTALAFAGDDPEHVLAYAAAADLGLVVSRDGGRSWTAAGLVLGGGDAVAYVAAAPGAAGVLYAASYGQDLYRLGDEDGTWRVLARNGVPAHGDEAAGQ